MTTKGKPTVDTIPPRGVRGGWDWDAMAMLAQLTGKPVRAGADVPMSRIKSVRSYRRPPFVTDEGQIIINMRNSHKNDQGITVGDLYFTWKVHEDAG
jgi:hypothetical protein